MNTCDLKTYLQCARQSVEQKMQMETSKTEKLTEEKHEENLKTSDNVHGRTYFSLLLLVTLLSGLTRLYEIQNPKHICWDETHFGKMGSWYIKREFFFDVHPPLGKMLIGLFGVMTGYDGQFPFDKPGDEYGDTNYVGMRMCCGLMGAAIPSLAFMSVWHLTHSLMASFLSSILIILDVGTLTLSRHILLDPILMFFIMMATYCQLKFSSYNQTPFSVGWWFWLAMTGVFISASIGVKFVGLFIILLIGFTTVSDLWNLLGNHFLAMTDIIKHFVARVVCLILIPIVVYMIIFAVHFKVLNHSGNGDGFYSSAFQSQLIGNKLYNVSMPENIAFGSIITLKQRRTGGAYLHSHWHLYPEDHPPRQQQLWLQFGGKHEDLFNLEKSYLPRVMMGRTNLHAASQLCNKCITTYAHKDYNNYWKIKMADREAEENETAQLIVSGDLVRLEHVVTRRNLHSHAEQAPLSKKHYQVSGYGTNGTGDANDVWIVEVVGYPLGTPIQTARSKLKFIHYHVRCALYSHDKKLPKWGWEQMEATCNPNLREPKAVWSVEEISDERLPNASFELYSPSFAEKIMESHAVMTQGNSGLKPKEGEITSRPWQWPINFRGQIFSGKDHRIYLLGNPIIFWGCLVAMAIFLLLYLIHSVKVKRKIKENELWRAYKEKVFGACWWLFLGWALHYLPFWPMTRVLYFHHYFPAFLYSAMLTGITIDFSVTAVGRILPESWTMVVFHTIIGSVLGILALSFYLFYPLTYGMSGPMAQQEGSMMYGLKWMDSWDI